MNNFDSKVSFVNIIRAHGLATKETSTGPTVVVVVGATIITTLVYDTYCYIQPYFRYSDGVTDKI